MDLSETLVRCSVLPIVKRDAATYTLVNVQDVYRDIRHQAVIKVGFLLVTLIQ